MRRCGVVFVHGISTGRATRATIRPRMLRLLEKHAIVPRLVEERYVNAALWRSSGDFAADLDIIARLPGLRDDAISDVADSIEQLAGSLEHAGLSGGDALPPTMLVMGHSFGQVFGYMALRKLVDERRISIPFSFLSLGGPLGNPNPIFRQYLNFARKGPLKRMDGSLAAWSDMYNEDDAVCSNNLSPHVLMSLLPAMHSNALTMLIGAVNQLGGHSLDLHSNFENAQSVKFDFPGHPVMPLAEHSSYFESHELYDLAGQMIADLQNLP